MRLIKDQKGILKGFGFVRFATKEAADKALKELSGSMLDGKKIGVLPSVAQDTLFLGNLNKGWSADDFNKVIRQVFPDVVSIDLAMLQSGSDTANKKLKNHGFAFVKFSSYATAARAFRAGSKPDFVLGGTLHPSVKWAKEDPKVDPDELAKIKIAFVRKLPSSTDEDYLKRLFMPFGKVEKVVVSSKGDSSVGFVHFSQRSHLDNAIEGLNEKKIVQGLKGGPSIKVQVEVARPMDKKRKRVYEDPQNTQPHDNLYKPRAQNHEPFLNSFDGHEETLQKEPVVDPHEAAVLLLPVAIRERLLRILRLGIATRFDIEVESLANLAELPESKAISVLDQFMLSGADKHDKGGYLAGLISRIKCEISTMKLLRHPNVIRMHEFMASKTKIYIVLEFVTGGELFDKIATRGRLKEDEARKYFQQLINAVDYCHSRRVFHIDLKPENLLLDASGCLKVSDFGLSALPQQVREDGLLHTTCGTPNYVAPEVINNKGYDGAKADLWSCGVILFVLMLATCLLKNQILWLYTRRYLRLTSLALRGSLQVQRS